jgi:hypothetical protein
MSKNNSSGLIYGFILGGLITAGFLIYFGSKYISKSKTRKQERKHKFYEGIDNIFDTKYEKTDTGDAYIDDATEKGIIEELFSRSN